MKEIVYPFDNTVFSSKTSVFIDACFLLALLDKKDRKFQECIDVSKILLDNKCQLYISPIVLAEVINKLIYQLFLQDILHQTYNSKPINSLKNIKIIIRKFSKADQNNISKSIIKEINKINFKKYFDRICKSNNYKLLEVYFQKATELEKVLESKLHIKYVSINKQTVIDARNYISQDLMGVNDAFHLSITIQNNIDYLLTLDKDFKRIQSSNNVTILKI
ncbi:MAG: PINc domain-containing protein [Thermoanaerobacterium thermosaccharolyticum]